MQCGKRELADNVVQLHAYLYPEAAYAYHLPEEIKRISEDIAWMSDVKKIGTVVS